MKQDVIDNEKEFELLYRTLTKARGFHLYLVQCNNSILRSKIQVSLKERLAADGITVYLHDLQKEVKSLADLLPADLDVHKHEKSALMVNGLDRSFFMTADSQAFLQRLNYARDLLPKRIPVPLVLWLPVGAFKMIMTEAHDFWSWRSGTFYFSTPPEMIQAQFIELTAEKEKKKGKKLSEKSYRERLALFADLLEELKIQPQTEKNRLQQADVLQQIAEIHYSYTGSIIPPGKKTEYLEKALSFQGEALAIKESILGKSHLEAAASYDNLSHIYIDLGRWPEAIDSQDRAIKIREAILDRRHPDLARSYYNLSWIYQARGEYDRALEYLEKSLQISRETGDKAVEGIVLNNIGDIYLNVVNYDSALDYLQQSLRISREIGDKAGEGTALNNISKVYRSRGEYDRALEYLQHSLQIMREIGDRAGEGKTLNNISQIFDVRGDYNRALDYLQQSLQIMREIGDKAVEGIVLNNISGVYQIRGDYDKALTYLQQSLQISREIGDKAGEGTALGNVATIYHDREKYDLALKYMQQSLQISREIGDRELEGKMLNNIGLVYKARGEYDRALDYQQQSLQISREIGYKEGITSTLHNIAIIYHSKKDINKFIEYETEAYKIALETQDAMGLYSVGRDLGEVLYRMGKKKEGAELLKRSYEIGKQAGFPDVEKIEAMLEQFGEIK